MQRDDVIWIIRGTLLRMRRLLLSNSFSFFWKKTRLGNRDPSWIWQPRPSQLSVSVPISVHLDAVTSLSSALIFLFFFSSGHKTKHKKMAGAIIENMSTKKLVIVGVVLLLFQAFAFMVGGLIGELFGNSADCRAF